MTTLFNSGSVNGQAITRGKVPRIAGMLGVPLDFTIDQNIQVSLNVLKNIRNVTGIDGIQSVYIDNSNNPNIVKLTFDNGPTINCPPYSQATFPVFFSGEVLTFKAGSVGNTLVNLWFLNTKEFAAVWQAKFVGGSTVVSGSVFTSPLPGLYTDSSIVATGASQALFAVSAARQGFMIRNPALAISQNIAAPEPCYINFGAAAVINGATSWELLPGESLLSGDIGLVTTQACNVIAATAGHIVICKVM